MKIKGGTVSGWLRIKQSVKKVRTKNASWIWKYCIISKLINYYQFIKNAYIQYYVKTDSMAKFNTTHSTPSTWTGRFTTAAFTILWGVATTDSRTSQQHLKIAPRGLPGCKHYMQLESKAWVQIQLANISVKDILKYTHF